MIWLALYIIGIPAFTAQFLMDDSTQDLLVSEIRVYRLSALSLAWPLVIVWVTGRVIAFLWFWLVVYDKK